MARTQRSAEPSAIDMLAQDHKRVQKLFKDFEKVDRGDEEAVRELVETACLELQIHSMLEEELFYPAVRAQAEGASEDLLNEAEIEHEAADDLIARLHELEPDDAMYCAYFHVLSEYVKHHIREEEHELFPHVAKMKLDLAKLGEDMRLRREELFAEMERADDEGEESQRALTAQPGEVPTPEPEDEELEDEQEQIDISRTRH
jgi:iron-sulfur cluster repair protein YtfE (RIC family)